jgi:hypothetical protein
MSIDVILVLAVVDLSLSLEHSVRELVILHCAHGDDFRRNVLVLVTQDTERVLHVGLAIEAAGVVELPVVD